MRSHKYPMKSVVIASFFRATNLILKSQSDGGRTRDREWFHGFMKPHSPKMRDYL
jgi:hypothetical protein